MVTESHGSEGICLAAHPQFLLRFIKSFILKDSRAAECDIVKVTKGDAWLSVLGVVKDPLKFLPKT